MAAFRSVAALALAGWLFAPAIVAAQTDFPLPVFDTGGKFSEALAYGDLNADGRPDAAVANSDNDKLGILIGLPGGRFQDPAVYATGDGPRAVAIADFDLDGRNDVVTFNETAGTLTIVLLPTSGPVTWTVPAGGNGSQLAVGDLDHDGDADVVTANSTQQTLSVLLGLGAGGVSAPVTYPIGGRPQALALEDFDGDGALDVVTSNSDTNNVTLRLGDGIGGLLPATTLATSASVGALVADDLDADGDQDLAVLATPGPVILVLLNGPGGFAAPLSVPLAPQTSRLFAGDLDDDGLPELLVCDFEGLHVLPGTGGGSFGAPSLVLPTGPSVVLLADATADGRVDALALLGGLIVFAGDGTGGLAAPAPLALGAESRLFALGDVNGDGRDDLVSTSVNDDEFPFPATAGTAYVSLADGLGGWGAPVAQPIGGLGYLELADVTGDNRLDLITQGDWAGEVRVVPGDGNGGFGPATADIDIGSDHGTSALAADLDLDGDVDLVLLCQLEWFMGTTFRNLVSLRNDGGGQWTKFVLNFSSAPQFASPDHFVLGDCDGDSRPDVVVMDRNGQTYFLGGVGHSQFGIGPVPPNAGGTPGGDPPLSVADLDGDGALDLLTTSTSSVSVAYGNGNGTFDPRVTLGPGPGSDLAVADVDGDGTRELLSMQGTRVVVWRGNGLGGYTPRGYYAGPNDRSFVVDPDGDGRVDLLALSAFFEFPGILVNPAVGQLVRNDALHAGWTDLGHGLAGVAGIPVLVGQGVLKAGKPGSLKLSHANPNKLAVLFIGPAALPTPFKGGKLVPVPPTIIFMLATNAVGAISLSWNSWPAMPPGTDWFFQYGIVDFAGPAGASLSNALRALVP